jgi:hypothetical protein
MINAFSFKTAACIAMVIVFLFCANSCSSEKSSISSDSSVLSAEFIQIAEDSWHFETAKSKERFVPWGANLVFGNEDQTINQDKHMRFFSSANYDKRLADRLLSSMAELNMNVLKIHLDVAHFLPDPQTPTSIQISKANLENLDHFVSLAEKHGIRLILNLFTYNLFRLEWYLEGGMSFGPVKGVEGSGDALRVLQDFWRQMAVRYKDNPYIFSYSLCTEFNHGVPFGNSSIQAVYQPYYETVGTAAWQQWLKFRYQHDIKLLNESWSSSYMDWSEIFWIDQTWPFDYTEGEYVEGNSRVYDFQMFRESTNHGYFKSMIDAIRSVDNEHMVSAGMHPRSVIDLWPGAARYFRGLSYPEQYDLFDYITYHYNMKPPRALTESQRQYQLEQMFREVETDLRFAYVGKPIIVEEFYYMWEDLDVVDEVHREFVKRTIGHASGWLTWPLQGYGNAGPVQGIYGPLDTGFSPTPWGKTVKEWNSSEGFLQVESLDRKAPATYFYLDHKKEMIAASNGFAEEIKNNWNDLERPFDFEWDGNPFIKTPEMVCDWKVVRDEDDSTSIYFDLTRWYRHDLELVLESVEKKRLAVPIEFCIESGLYTAKLPDQLISQLNGCLVMIQDDRGNLAVDYYTMTTWEYRISR